MQCTSEFLRSVINCSDGRSILAAAFSTFFQRDHGAQGAAPAKGGLSDMNLGKHCARHSKIAPTKDGKWSKADLEFKAFKDFVSHLSLDSSVPRRHPVIRLSVFAGMLTSARRRLQAAWATDLGRGHGSSHPRHCRESTSAQRAQLRPNTLDAASIRRPLGQRWCHPMTNTPPWRLQTPRRQRKP